MSETQVTELYRGRVRVEFTQKGHKYIVYVDGKPTKPPSVTKITGIIDKSGPLVNWAVNMALDVCKENIAPKEWYSQEELNSIWAQSKKAHYVKKQEAADIGTNTHKWLEKFFASQIIDLPPQDADYRPSVDAAVKWSEQHKIQFLLTERPIYSIKYKFSGYTDGIALVDNKLTLVDYKTGNNIYDEVWLQTAGYQFAYEEETGEEIEQRLVIRLGKADGHFYSQVQPRKTLKPDFKAFLGAMALHKRLAELKKLKKQEDTSKSWLDEE